MNSPHKCQWHGALMFFYLRPNKWLRNQSRHRWFETPARPLWLHCKYSISWSIETARLGLNSMYRSKKWSGPSDQTARYLGSVFHDLVTNRFTTYLSQALETTFKAISGLLSGWLNLYQIREHELQGSASLFNARLPLYHLGWFIFISFVKFVFPWYS